MFFIWLNEITFLVLKALHALLEIGGCKCTLAAFTLAYYGSMCNISYYSFESFHPAFGSNIAISQQVLFSMGAVDAICSTLVFLIVDASTHGFFHKTINLFEKIWKPLVSNIVIPRQKFKLSTNSLKFRTMSLQRVHRIRKLVCSALMSI